MAKCFVIGLDVGILLTKENEEFDFYAQVYDHKYGYYDEDQIAYKAQDTEEAIKYAKQYVADGVDMTYAVITNQGHYHYDEPFDGGNIDGFTYNCEDVIYSVAKINNQIIENFIINGGIKQ